MASLNQEWTEDIEVSSENLCGEISRLFIFAFLLDQGYEIVRELGKGGFATVYQARCLKSGYDVAIKMVNLIK